MRERYSGSEDEISAPGGSRNILPEDFVEVLHGCVASGLSDDQILTFLEACDSFTGVQNRAIDRMRKHCKGVSSLFGDGDLLPRTTKILNVIRGAEELKHHRFSMANLSEEVFMDENETNLESGL
jgi:hypothetical protein